MKLAGAVMICCCAVLAGVVRADEAGLIFHAPFDNFKVDAAVAGGDPKCSFKESIELRNFPGVKGGALALNDEERCEYDVKGNFNPLRGTLSIWVKPVNWDGKDGLFHHFVCVTDRNAPSGPKNVSAVFA